ncbi:MAG: alkaline phosphatase family protein [Planctomycetes bacterium]|nr:alkaline phosphatase family protein [Planctomycetota bacterium]
MPVRDYQVLIVGLDGATFDLMLPWIEEGRLPHLARLLQGGSHSRLESTIPPITPCAWSSFMTGKNPGKHGLFDFVEPDLDGHGFRFTNASFRDGETLWGCLSRHGRRVGVVNVPMTYPPEPVNGFLISGLDTPHEYSPFMYPIEIRHELKEAGICYRIDQQHLGNMRTNDRRRQQLLDIIEAESSRTRAFRHLSDLRPCDFRMIVYGATDQVQHHFWHYMDPAHDKHDPAGANEYRHAIRDTYQQIDRHVGQLLEESGDDTIVIVMSDHGFGKTSNVRLRLNQVLRDAGLLEFVEAERDSVLRRTAGWLDGILRSTLSSDVKRTLAGLFPRLRVWFENLDEAKIDWNRTAAYVHEAYRSSPAIWLNGGLAGDQDANDLRRQVANLLTALVDTASGERVINNCYFPREIYDGPHTSRAPDVLPSWWEDGFLLDQSMPLRGARPNVERSTSPIQGGVEFAGSHRLDGVFIASGGPLRPGFGFKNAQIIDVAPTVLYLMGIPIPDDMDGRVLTEALDDDYVASHPIQWESAGVDEINESFSAPQEFTENESELIARRLQALGYIS